MLSITVVKIGGSLMRCPELLQWLESIIAISEKTKIVIVPGGGIFADHIRDLQIQYQFSDKEAHRMALLAMAQYGFFLQGINPALNIRVAYHRIGLDKNSHTPFIWLPFSLLQDFSEIKPDWQNSSDSIALWLAGTLSAERLILLKACMPGMKNTLSELVNIGYLDAHFPLYSSFFKGKILCFSKDQNKQLKDIFDPDKSDQYRLIF